MSEEKKKKAVDSLREAFLRGAKWWEFKSTGATMWQSDQKLVYEEAEQRYKDCDAD